MRSSKSKTVDIELLARSNFDQKYNYYIAFREN